MRFTCGEAPSSQSHSDFFISRTHLEFLLEIERQYTLSEYTKAQNNVIPESSVCQETFGPATCIRITELLI